MEARPGYEVRSPRKQTTLATLVPRPLPTCAALPDAPPAPAMCINLRIIPLPGQLSRLEAQLGAGLGARGDQRNPGRRQAEEWQRCGGVLKGAYLGSVAPLN